MAHCPNCTRTFRTLEDEEGMHACPSCGYHPNDYDVWPRPIEYGDKMNPYPDAESVGSAGAWCDSCHARLSEPHRPGCPVGEDAEVQCNVCGLDISTQATLISLEGYCGLACYWQEFEQEHEPLDRIIPDEHV